jgi:hypothetical protein
VLAGEVDSFSLKKISFFNYLAGILGECPPSWRSDDGSFGGDGVEVKAGIAFSSEVDVQFA